MLAWIKHLFGSGNGRAEPSEADRVEPAITPPEQASGPLTREEMTPEQQRIYDEFAAEVHEMEAILRVDPNEPREESYARAAYARRMLAKMGEAMAGHASFINLENQDAVIQAIDRIERRYGPLIAPENPDNMLVAIIDTETTGLKDHDEPISIGIVLVEVVRDRGDFVQEVEAYYALREPGCPIDPRAHAVHGLTMNDVRGQAWDILFIIRLLESAEVLIAHNAKFDRRMLAGVIGGVEALEWACSIHSLKYDWARITNGQRSLDAICGALNIARQEPHNALNDCRALLEVLKLRSGKTARSRTLMGKLIANAWAPSY